MNPLKEKINIDLKESLKTGDAFKRSVLGMLKAAIANKEIEKRKKEEGLNEAELQEVVRSEAKKRADAAGAFRAAGNEERAKSEEAEAEILKQYLPPELSDDEVKAVLEKVIAGAGTKSKHDFGRLMGAAVKEIAGRADGNKVKRILESMLD